MMTKLSSKQSCHAVLFANESTLTDSPIIQPHLHHFRSPQIRIVSWRCTKTMISESKPEAMRKEGRDFSIKATGNRDLAWMRPFASWRQFKPCRTERDEHHHYSNEDGMFDHITSSGSPFEDAAAKFAFRVLESYDSLTTRGQA